MKTRASLVIKHYSGEVAANTCIGGQSLVSSGWSASVEASVSRAVDSRFDYISVLIAIDFTRMLSLEQDFSNVLYVQVHPMSSGSNQPQPAHESPLTGRVCNFSLRYDFRIGFVNTAELFHLVDKSKPRYIAVNTPYVISKYNIEDQICRALAERYPKVIVYPSRHLTNHDFFTRGNTLLLNLLLRSEVERYIAGVKKVLNIYGINCPMFFLRNSGMVGESTLKHTGMDTSRSEDLCFLYDVLSLHAHEDMYIADWTSASLYFVHQGSPQMIRMPVEFGGIRVYGQIPVRYSLQSVGSCAQLLELLNAHNPFPGPVLFVSAGTSPFPIPRLFEYPATEVHPDSLSHRCGLRRAAYSLELEAFDHGRSAAETEHEVAETLKSLALQDAVPLHAIHLNFERLPLKYLNDQLIIRVALNADLGAFYEADK